MDSIGTNGKTLPLLAQYYCEISNTYNKQNQIEKSIAISKKALRTNPECIRANYQLAKYYSKNDKERCEIAYNGRLKYFYEGKAEASYVGEFKEGMRDGIGKWKLIDGTSFYEGEWKLDKWHGKGTYMYLDEVKQGYWFMGRFKCYLDEALDPCNYIQTIK